MVDAIFFIFIAMKVILLEFYRFIKNKVVIIFLFTCVGLFSQNNFSLQEGKKSDKIKFELANNLIIIPVVVNDIELSFILDTGVSSTIIFSVDNTSSLELKNASKIYLRGLGDEEPVEAIKSTNNELRIGGALSSDQTIYLVLDESINFSPRMGFPIHGIIGYDFFKNFILDINYDRGYIRVHSPDSYGYKKCRKCFETTLDFKNQKKKPFITAQYKSKKGLIDVNLLLDSGSGSTLWLFENKEKGIQVNNSSFRDFLGKGFSGDIYGRKTKIEELRIGDFKLKEVKASFPDSIYLQGLSRNNRQGSLGGGILKRFNLIVDYPHKKISFKKNSFFDLPFYYNMGGLTIQHIGFTLGQNTGENYKYEENDRVYLGINNIVSKKTIQLANNFVLVPKYEISDVRPNSPADEAGLKKGDIIMSVNGRFAYNYKLSDLNELFYSEEGKSIRIKVQRLGTEIKYQFYLKKVL